MDDLTPNIQESTKNVELEIVNGDQNALEIESLAPGAFVASVESDGSRIGMYITHG